MSKLGTRLIKAAREARAIARGEITDGFVVHVPDDVDVKALRKKLNVLSRNFRGDLGLPSTLCRIGSSIGGRQTERRAFF
jgi:putative transcriptional regulator